MRFCKMRFEIGKMREMGSLPTHLRSPIAEIEKDESNNMKEIAKMMKKCRVFFFFFLYQMM